MAPVFDLSNIATGIILAAPALTKIQGISIKISLFAEWLKKYQLIFGCVSLILGLYFLFRPGYIVHDIVGICAGLLLLSDRVGEVPGIGEYLEKICNALSPLNQAIGIMAILVGLFGFFNIGIFA